jgi:hypothetical protein
MLSFSKDADILRHEPILFGELHFPWQVLTEGTSGALSGTTFTKAGVDFESPGVSANGVIYLSTSDGVLDGTYEIVSVDSATQLTVSVLRVDEDSDAIAPPQGSNISYRVSSFAPQANEAFFSLTQYFGVQPGNPDSEFDADDILDISGLRQASSFAVIASVYATLACRSEESKSFWKKSLHYQKLFAAAKQRCRVSIDTGNDGISDRTNIGASIRLQRD